MTKNIRHTSSLWIFSVTVWGILSSATLGGEFSVVIHPDNPLDSISYQELIDIFKAKKQYWSNHKKIFLILPHSGSNEKEFLLEKVYHTSERELKAYWISLLYQNKIATFPKVIPSPKLIVKIISKRKNAIAIIPTEHVTSAVKAFAISRTAIGDIHYQLQ